MTTWISTTEPPFLTHTASGLLTSGPVLGFCLDGQVRIVQLEQAHADEAPQWYAQCATPLSMEGQVLQWMPLPPAPDSNEDATLDARMRARGMMPLSEMLKRIPLGNFMAHAGVTDLDSYKAWLTMRRASMLKMQMQMELDKRQDDDLYEWAIAHVAVLTEALANFLKATGHTDLENIA